jgi:hypothetical protein
MKFISDDNHITPMINTDHIDNEMEMQKGDKRKILKRW